MAGSYQLLLGGQQADATLYTLITSVEVEESMDLPAAVQITVPVSRATGGDLILLDVDGGTITIEDGNGNTVTLDSSGLTLKGAGQSAALGTSGVNINNGAFEVTA